MGHPDLRVGHRIFATLGHPRPGYAEVRLSPVEQAGFVAMVPGTFESVPGKWGEQGATLVVLAAARTPPVRAALKAAYEKRVVDNRPAVRRRTRAKPRRRRTT